MKHLDRLIFVSGSDTAVGPMAEAIMQSKFLLEELAITSKGVIVLFPEPINPKAEAVLVSNGLTMKDHMSDPLVREDFEERTLILALRPEVKQKIVREFGEEYADKIRILNDYVGRKDTVSDPYGGSLADYGQCFAELEVLISRLVIQLNEEELLC